MSDTSVAGLRLSTELTLSNPSNECAGSADVYS